MKNKAKMTKAKSFNPNYDMDILEMEDNKQFFHQLNHLSVVSNIKNKNYGKAKKLQQKNSCNNKNYAKTKTNKNKKRNCVPKFRTLQM